MKWRRNWRKHDTKEKYLLKIALPKRNAIKKDINEAEYNDLQKAKRNAEYLAMLDKSEEERKVGKIIVKTMEELEALEN